MTSTTYPTSPRCDCGASPRRRCGRSSARSRITWAAISEPSPSTSDGGSSRQSRRRKEDEGTSAAEDAQSDDEVRFRVARSASGGETLGRSQLLHHRRDSRRPPRHSRRLTGSVPCLSRRTTGDGGAPRNRRRLRGRCRFKGGNRLQRAGRRSSASSEDIDLPIRHRTARQWKLRGTAIAT